MYFQKILTYLGFPSTTNKSVFVLANPMRENSARYIGDILGSLYEQPIVSSNKNINFLLSQWTPEDGDSKVKIVNVGYTTDMGMPNNDFVTWINRPNFVIQMMQKLKMLNHLKSACRIPEFTKSLSEALSWSTPIGYSEMSDTVHLSDNLGYFGGATFWMKYKPHKAQYRVHMVRQEVINVDIRMPDLDVNPAALSLKGKMIRNKHNGWFWSNLAGKGDVPPDVIYQARLAMAASALDFAAVTVLYNKSEGRGYVYEVDPLILTKGFQDSYAAPIKKLLDSL